MHNSNLVVNAMTKTEVNDAECHEAELTFFWPVPVSPPRLPSCSSFGALDDTSVSAVKIAHTQLQVYKIYFKIILI